jgi:hypothetical protein
MPSKLVIQTEIKGLGVKLNLNRWPVESQTNARQTRRFIVGEIANTATGETKLFNDAGELLTILGKWNALKFKKLPKPSGTI